MSVAFAWIIAFALVIQGLTAVHHSHADGSSPQASLSNEIFDGFAAVDPTLGNVEHEPHPAETHRDCPACLVSAVGLHVLLAVAAIDWPPSKDTLTALDLRQQPRKSAPREAQTIRGPPPELNT